MKYLLKFFILSIVFIIGCNKNNIKTNTTANKNSSNLKMNLSESPSPKLISLKTLNDFSINLASAGLYTKDWGKKQFVVMDRWVNLKFAEYFRSESYLKAYNLWKKYANLYENTKDLYPTKDFLNNSGLLLKIYQKQGGIKESFHLILFLNRFESNKYSNKVKEILLWVLETDKLEYFICINKSRVKERKSCATKMTGDNLFLSLLNKYGYLKDNYFNYLKYILKAPKNVTGFIDLLKLKKVSKIEKGILLDRVVSMAFYTQDPIKNIKNILKLKQIKIVNSFLHKNLLEVVSKNAKPIHFESLSSYLAIRVGNGVSLKVCKHMEKIFPESGLSYLCLAKAMPGLENSLLQRKYLLKSVIYSPLLKESWDYLFKIGLNRFYNFVNREKLKSAKKEAAYLKKIYLIAEKLFPKKGFVISFSTLHLALSDLYQIRGRIKEAKNEILLASKEKITPRILTALVRLEFWEGEYEKMSENMEKFKLLKENKFESMFYYLKNSRFYALVLEKFKNEIGKSKRVRLSTLHIFNKFFGLVNMPAIRIEIITEIGKLYLDMNKPDLAIQIFQKALYFKPKCGTYRDLLKNLIIYDQINGALDIYLSLMGEKSCKENAKFYASMWIYYLGKRSKINSDRISEAKDFIKEYRGDKWLEVLSKFVLEKINFETLNKKAKNIGQKTEALYYNGQRYWIKNDLVNAHKYFEKVLKTNIYVYTEFEFSFWFLKILKKLK
jgi:lipoprotein NlpI